MRLRLRPLFVALSFLSFFALGGVATACLPALLRGGGPAFTLVGAAALLGAALGASAFATASRPGLVWSGALVTVFVFALPVSVMPGVPVLVLAALAAALGLCSVGVVIGAVRAVAGGPDTPGQDLAQVLGVSALGATFGVLLPHAGLVATEGFDGLARLAGGLALGVGVLVLFGLRVEKVASDDEPLFASPPRLFGLGGVLAAMLVLTQATLAQALGESVLTRPVIFAGLLLGAGLALARVAARDDLDADLGWRRATQASGLAFAALVLLAPRLPAAFVFTEAVVRPSTAGWLVSMALRVVLIALVTAPVVFVAASALGCSARDAVRTPANAGRWLSGLLFGATMGWWLTSALLSAASHEWLVFAAAAGAIAVASWQRLDLYPAVLIALALLLGRGWTTDLARSGSAAQWRRAMPGNAANVELVARNARDVVTVHREGGKQQVRAGGHLELTTGRAAERPLLGVHTALLTGAGQVRSALVLGVSPGVVEVLAAHGVNDIDVVAPAGLLDAAGRAGVSFVGATTHAAEPRAFLEAATKEWELIVMLPSRPGTPVSRGLFTLEAWQAARRRLSPAGQLVQRVDLQESNTTVVQTVLRTLRIVFPTGITVGGVGELSFVVSGVSQVLDPERVAVRMKTPAVASSLAALELASPVALFAWQVHSAEGQVRFAGPGPASTDRLPLPELAVPLAAFVDETVDLGDERAGQGSGLVLSQLVAEGQLGKAGYQAIHGALARHYAAWEPLVRSSAEAWAALDPESSDAVVAVARSALAQNDVASAVEVLAPRLRDEYPAPAIVAAALEAMTAQLGRESAVFRPLDPEPLLALGRKTLDRHPESAQLAAAVKALEAAR